MAFHLYYPLIHLFFANSGHVHLGQKLVDGEQADYINIPGIRGEQNEKRNSCLVLYFTLSGIITPPLDPCPDFVFSIHMTNSVETTGDQQV